MNKDNRFWKIALPALLAMVMAGAAVCALAGALGLAVNAALVYAAALLTAALFALATVSVPMLLVSSAAGVLLLGGIIAAQSDGLRQMGALWTALSTGGSLDGAMQAARLIQLLAAVAFSGVLFLLLSRSGATAFALVIEGAALIGGYAMRPEMSLAAAIPGVAAALYAFALSGGLPRDAGAWRILVPVGLSMALAFALTPQSGTTWTPLEELAQRVRSAFEDYFRFTEERIPFALSSEGYDHAAEVDGGVVARLGGPATPDSDPVMRVTADAPVLLRGSIRRTYTGHTWVDSDAKARYLFYDFTRKRVREDVFGMTGNDWMPAVNVSVSLMTGGTSTLFVPGRMASFDMDYNTAVYYNSIGEMFLARPVEDGDAYSLVGCAAPDEDALRAAVERMRDAEDANYASIVDSCTQLPSGIENGVYALTMELTQNASNAADKALAIEHWLRNNCVYTLTPDYPDESCDFVSQFVLDGREGYCSYFASAMTVMCRIAGLPARYVEGYSVSAAGADQILTGEDAHAWTEVYFSGVGWIAFDPSNGSGGGDDGLSNEHTPGETADQPDSADPSATPEPDGMTTPPPEDGSTPGPEESPTPEPDAPDDTPNPDEAPTPPPDGEPSPTPESDWGNAETTPPPGGASEPPDNSPDDSHRNRAWLWILLALLLLALLIALIVWWAKRRLAAADPIRLSENAEDSTRAALILYRSLLTLLSVMGVSPLPGETPAAFAQRAALPDRGFAAFAAALEKSVYARGGADEQTVALGQSAYEQLLTRLRRGEKLRFLARRILRGLGDFEQIP